MPRLFYKIFLWFWIGIVAVSATLVMLTEVSHSRADDDRRWRTKYGPRVDLWARQEVQILRREGPAGLEKYVNSFQSDRGVRNYIYDADAREMLGRPSDAAYMPSVLRSMAAATAPRQQQSFDAERVIAEKIVGADGRAFVVVVDFPQPSPLGLSLSELLFEDIETAALMRIVGVLAVASLACFWLARQLVHPIERLRAATRAIADEHLQTRVDPTLLARRDELADLGRDFDQMAERIEHLVATHRHLLADVSHALRSPLARLSVALALVRRTAAPEAALHIDRIEHEAARLNTLIGQLLTMARLDGGVDLEQLAPFDLGLLIDEVAVDANYEARARRGAVVFTPAPPCIIVGAREMLRGAIENVVRNAVRHTAPGTAVEITLRCTMAPEQSLAIASIRDHGPGVSPDTLPHLFTPFHHVPGGSAAEGSGLGLAITKRAIDIHHGRIGANNLVDGGLLVTIVLPAHRPAEAATEQAEVSAAECAARLAQA